MKKVKIITITLAIILVTLIAFAGIYMQTQNRMENKVKDYLFSKELEGGRLIELVVAENDTEELTENQEDNAEEKVEEDKDTLENYKIVKKTIENRLKSLDAQDYTISLDEEEGTIRIEMIEDDNTDSYIYYLTASNKVSITEKDTENELIKDEMIKSAKYKYTSDAENQYTVFLELALNKEGQAKIEELSDEYAFLAEEIDKIEEQQKEETDEEIIEGEENTENTENNIEETESEEKQEETENQKKIAVLKISDTEYDITKIEKNKITVQIGSKTSNSTNINNYMATAAELTMLINTGKYPLEYEVMNNRFVYSDISREQITYFALIVAVIIIIALIVISIIYKTKGILSAISFVGFVALLSIVLRYTNVLISIEGIGAIILIIIINFKFNQEILSKIQKMNLVNEAINSTYKEMFIKLIPIIIISLVFCFSGWMNLSSFGMIMFWGLILIAVYNIIVTKTMLKLKENK